MDRTLLVLVTAHLVGDFVLQPAWMVRDKRVLAVLLLHVALVTATTALLLGGLPLGLLAILFATHVAMDWLKANRMNDRPWTPIGAFTIDQLVHLGVLLLLAGWFPAAADDGLWPRALAAVGPEPWLRGLTLVAALVLAVPVGGHVIAMLTAPLLREMDVARLRDEIAGARVDLAGLRHGGRVIGWLERGLVLLLMLTGQPGGVGFLVAAKSILRFGDVKDGHQRRVAEYVIIGTFTSFGWALVVSLGTLRVLGWWDAPG